MKLGVGGKCKGKAVMASIYDLVLYTRQCASHVMCLSSHPDINSELATIVNPFYREGN